MSCVQACEQVVRRSRTLRQWQTAHGAARMCQNCLADLGVGAHPDRVMIYRPSLDRWTAERDRLYSLLTPADKATADRIKETP